MEWLLFFPSFPLIWYPWVWKIMQYVIFWAVSLVWGKMIAVTLRCGKWIAEMRRQMFLPYVPCVWQTDCWHVILVCGNLYSNILILCVTKYLLTCFPCVLQTVCWNDSLVCAKQFADMFHLFVLKCLPTHFPCVWQTAFWHVSLGGFKVFAIMFKLFVANCQLI